MSASALPVSIADQIRKELTNVDNTLMPASSNKISTKGKVFTLPTGKSSPGPVRAIILDYIQFNSWYESAWNPNAPQMPGCWAINRDVAALTPSTLAPKPQHTTCAGCPKDQWGSGAGKGKACKNQYRLVIVEGDLKEESQPMTLYVSPSGMKQFSNYVRDLKAVYDMLPIQVVTTIAFDANSPYPTLTFAVDKPHSNLELAWLMRTKAAAMLQREPDRSE